MENTGVVYILSQLRFSIAAIPQGGCNISKYPIAFPNKALGAAACGEYSYDGTDNVVQLGKDNYSLECAHNRLLLDVFWIAIGY